MSGTIPIDIVSSFFFQHHLLITAFTAAESLLTSVHVNIFALHKFILAIVAEAEETLRRIIWPVFLPGWRKFGQTITALHNAIIKDMSGSWIWPMSNHTSIILRKLHFTNRETPFENLRRIRTLNAEIPRPKWGFLSRRVR